MKTKAITVLPFLIITVALLTSMYLVFNTESLLAKDETKAVVAGASCPAPEKAFMAEEDSEIHFVGCGGFF